MEEKLFCGKLAHNIGRRISYIKIVNWKLSEITPDIKNAKEHPQKQIDQIKGSIKEFGFNDPIAVDENNVIIGGHGRSNN